MKRYIIAILFFGIFSSTQLFSQFFLQGIIKDYGKLKKVYLYEYDSNRYHLLDTTDIKNGNFKFNIGVRNTFKMLELRFTPDQAIKGIIFYNENIVLKTNLGLHKKNIKFIKSKENQIYQNYLQIANRVNQKEKAINYLQHFYKPGDKFYQTLKSELLKIKTKVPETIKNLEEKNKKYIVSKIIKYEQIPIQEKNSKESLSVFLRKHYWDNIDFSDTIIIHLPLLASKINDFFALFEIPNISHEAQEKLFQLPTDIVLSKSKSNKLVYKSVLTKLLDDSYDFGLRNLYNYIVDSNMLNDSIFSAEKIKEIRKRYKKNNSLKINSKAPNFKITDKLSLYDIKKNHILVVFWESDCIYCFNTLQKLTSIYDSLKIENFEVVAVSLDTNPNKFKQSILERGYNWINYCDFKGWLSNAAKKYDVTSTPTMFLLDKKKRIIAKPITIEQLLLKLRGK